ncbi:predicted protein [Lichtheimia corymbifera JMRC:FSU:9682]|uniref:Inhibitor I9 domain-containing protein n=1 Tax=Lichtheimia corymbifera JMRC:FSU:9682 TaxID=1263082 RepID=A0A068SCS0_9FUNG|nr:predicted protein [Lichtheimia corymbifera JMRC:FSU:9682]
MRFHFISFFIAALVALVAKAAEPGYTDYIMALKKSVDDAVIEQAKADVEAVNGKVIYEIKIGFQALIISLPNDQYTTFENKDYVDFIEEDQQVHINDNGQ